MYFPNYTQSPAASPLGINVPDPYEAQRLLKSNQGENQNQLQWLQQQLTKSGKATQTIPALGKTGFGNLPIPFTPAAPVAFPTAGTGPTLTEHAERSPELESQMAAWNQQLQGIASSYNAAFQNKSQTFNDVIRSLANTYRMQASGAGRAAGLGVLSSGMTPYEAQAAQSASAQNILRQFYPQQADLRSQQADVGIAAQQAQQSLNQQLSAFMSSVAAPYYKGVAGSQQTDYLGREKLAVEAAVSKQQMASQQQQMALDYYKTQQQMAIAQQSAEMQAQQLQQQMAQATLEAQYKQQYNPFALAEQQGQIDLQKILAQAQGQQANTQMQMGGQYGIASMEQQQAMARLLAGAQTDYAKIGLQNQGQLANTQLGGTLQNTGRMGELGITTAADALRTVMDNASREKIAAEANKTAVARDATANAAIRGRENAAKLADAMQIIKSIYGSKNMSDILKGMPANTRVDTSLPFLPFTHDYVPSTNLVPSILGQFGVSIPTGGAGSGQEGTNAPANAAGSGQIDLSALTQALASNTNPVAGTIPPDISIGPPQPSGPVTVGGVKYRSVEDYLGGITHPLD